MTWVQVIQYIDFIKPDSAAGTESTAYSWIPADGFGDDDKAGHGTHTAGTAAGATLNNPAETVECAAGQTLSCVGACIDAVGSDDDLVAYSYQADDIDRQCPMFGCDDETEPCLGDDVAATLSENGGMAQGAKLAIFDVASSEDFLSDFAGNNLWEPCLEAGCKIHSGSFGSDGTCELGSMDVVYDDFMYQVTPHTEMHVPQTGRNQYLKRCWRLPTLSMYCIYPWADVLDRNHGKMYKLPSTPIAMLSKIRRCSLAMVVRVYVVVFRNAQRSVIHIVHVAAPQNPENLLLFAAGNDGGNQFNTVCTIGSPGIGKNSLAVGATSAGETRLNSDGIYDIDHVASLSSWGFTTDGRIKPEVVAPGDTVGPTGMNERAAISKVQK